MCLPEGLEDTPFQGERLFPDLRLFRTLEQDRVKLIGSFLLDRTIPRSKSGPS